MRNIILGILFSLGIIALAFGQTAPEVTEAQKAEMQKQEELQNMILKTMTSTVSILELGEGMGRCSGVVIKNDKDNGAVVLTAKHCISPTEEFYVEDQLASDVGVSIYDDLAFVVTPYLKDKLPISIAPKVTAKGDMVFTVGYPNGDPYLSMGPISLVSKDWQFIRMNVIPGCSGGGVFNMKGELIGIIWGGLTTEETSIMEPLNDVLKFVKQKKLL